MTIYLTTNTRINDGPVKKTAFITGNSSGLGHGLTEECLRRDYHVYGLSRRGNRDFKDNITDVICDLGEAGGIPIELEKTFKNVSRLDLVFLNAGILGEIAAINEASFEQIQEVMDVNVWANKIILDWFLAHEITIELIIAISSGAAVNGSRGWSGYAISKASLNMLIQLYAHEFPHTHLISLAPGLVDTAMQDYLCDEAGLSARDFPTLQRLRDSRGTEHMKTPLETAKTILDLAPGLYDYPSGSFVDIRAI